MNQGQLFNVRKYKSVLLQETNQHLEGFTLTTAHLHVMWLHLKINQKINKLFSPQDSLLCLKMQNYSCYNELRLETPSKNAQYIKILTQHASPGFYKTLWLHFLWKWPWSSTIMHSYHVITHSQSSAIIIHSNVLHLDVFIIHHVLLLTIMLSMCVANVVSSVNNAL